MNTTATSLSEQELAAVLTAEQLVFSLLARLLLDHPNHEWIQGLVAEGLFEEIPLASRGGVQEGADLIRGWLAERDQTLDEETYNEIALDYTHLFVGPGRVLAPPWESVYFNENRLTFQQETLDVRNWYRRYGLESEKLRSEPDDHVGLELSFLAYLASQALAALRSGSPEEADELLAAQRQFLQAHPMRWVSQWAQEVSDHARTDFWRGIALLTVAYVEVLDEMLTKEKPDRPRS